MPEKTTHSETLAELARSAWLWPDPFDAPETPGRLRLEALLAGASADPELALQAAASPSCRRALETMAAEGVRPPEELAALLEPAPAAPPGAAEPPRLEPGAIWLTRPEVRVFDARRRASLRWRLSSPPAALPVEGPFTEGGGRFWRALLATPEEERPPGFLRADEVVVTLADGSRWHAHLRLEFPISEDQLALPVGELDAESSENLAVARGALAEGFSPPADTGAGSAEPWLSSAAERGERRREQARLLDRAGWLAANADARRLERAVEEEAARLSFEAGSLGRLEPEGVLVAAARADLAPGAGFIRVLFAALPLEELAAALAAGRDVGPVDWAETLAGSPRPRTAAPEETFAEWRLRAGAPRPLYGCRFEVLHRATGRLVGHGRAGTGGVLRLVAGPWERFRGGAGAELVLVVIHHP